MTSIFVKKWITGAVANERQQMWKERPYQVYRSETECSDREVLWIFIGLSVKINVDLGSALFIWIF